MSLLWQVTVDVAQGDKAVRLGYIGFGDIEAEAREHVRWWLEDEKKLKVVRMTATKHEER